MEALSTCVEPAALSLSRSTTSVALEVVVIFSSALPGPSFWVQAPHSSWCCLSVLELLHLWQHIGLEKESTSRVGQVLCPWVGLRFAKCPCTNLTGAVFA